MSKLKISAVLFSLVSLLTFVGCETDIDIVAPKKDVTVVYGLLEANQTTHYIRINRSFVGEDSASVLAAQPGVNEYSEEEIIQAEVQEIDANGAIRKRFGLISKYIYGKDDGNFFNDSNKVYMFNGALDYDYEYQLYLKIKPEGEEEKIVTATTTLLGSNDGTKLVLRTPRLPNDCDNRDSEIEWVDRSKNTLRTSSTIEWSSASNGEAYTGFLRVYYTDYYLDGTIVRDSVYVACGETSELNDDGLVEFVLNPREVFKLVANNVDDFDASVLSNRVLSDTIQFFIEVANDEFYLYRTINRPTSSVTQERPMYTNVVNGIGLFASKYFQSTRTEDFCDGRKMDGATLEEAIYSNTNDSDATLAKKGFTNPRCNDGTCI